MAITVTSLLSGNLVDASKRYKYLFEPLDTYIEEPTSEKLYITIKLMSLTDESTLETFLQYYAADFSTAQKIRVDLMAVARDFYDKETYKIGQASDITGLTILQDHYIRMEVTTDVIATPTILHLVPVLGQRTFEGFDVLFDHTYPLTEWEAAGLTQPDFNGYPKISTSLVDATGSNINPNITITTPSTGREVCGAYLIWKSRLGGWCSYGFDVFSEDESGKHTGKMGSELFSVNGSGFAYIGADYTGIEISNSMNVRSAGVHRSEALVLKGIAASPAVYIMRTKTSKLELARVTNVSAPIDNLTGGANVAITLVSVSKMALNVW